MFEYLTLYVIHDERLFIGRLTYILSSIAPCAGRTTRNLKETETRRFRKIDIRRRGRVFSRTVPNAGRTPKPVGVNVFQVRMS